MNMIKRMSKKELLKTYKNNYEVVLQRKRELSNENIELQQKVIEKDKLISELQKEKKVLKGKLTKAKNELNKYKANVKIELAPSIENGNKIIETVFAKKKEKENE